MGDPHRHHFIPSFYLSRWANTNGKLIEFTRKYNKLIPKPIGPDATGFETDLYEIRDLPPEQRQYLEKVWFNYLDRTAFEALTDHLNRKPVASWDNEHVNAWSRFVFGLHFRHPHAMPELRAATKEIWEARGADKQSEWEKIKKPDHPETFDEYLATLDPFTAAKMRLNLLIKIFDNPKLIGHLNQMPFAVIDASTAPERFVTSDRPVCIDKLAKNDGVIFLPISPTKLFVAANDIKSLEKIGKQTALDLVRRVNDFVIGRARLFVWACDQSLETVIRAKMSTNMEPLPFFPNAGKYP
jgi:Protein of unknown function (DUF4238)